MDLPAPSADAATHSARLAAHIQAEIAANGGWISFARYMELALYTPGLGYYSAGARKLGAAGDFVTAPEITPLFGQTLARVIAPLIAAGLPDLLEIGGGSGALAASLLAALATLDRLPREYLMLERSADLRERCIATLAARVPALMCRVRWLDTLPVQFAGVIVANEVLDALAVDVVSTRDEGIDEFGVRVEAGQFVWAARPAEPALLQRAAALALPVGYRTEIGRAAEAFTATLAQCLDRGAILLIDYGFPAHEFYHAQRSMGTLRCHYRHRALDDPFRLPGLQDITAHVDFSAIARAGVQAGLTLAGYNSQAQFLLEAGLLDVLSTTSPEDVARYLPLANAAQQLVSPSEMGELFKVIAFTKRFEQPIIGFSGGDRRPSLALPLRSTQ